jgi:DNA adenine methylase
MVFVCSIISTKLGFQVVFKAKPFLKWAGGKTQLLQQLDAYLPQRLKQGELSQYVEPFLGGAALFLYIAQHYPLKHYVLNDINPALIQVYRVVKHNVQGLMDELDALSDRYHTVAVSKQADFYYQIRSDFNQTITALPTSLDTVCPTNAARFIFLNKTGFNGLYRVNRKGVFNVPFGRYAKPTFYQRHNLLAVSDLLQSATLLCGDYTACDAWIDANTLVYMDPPYRPLTQTAHFTGYASSGFNDNDQLALAQFFAHQAGKGASLLLSNADPHNADNSDMFFMHAYAPFIQHRIQANRSINAVATKRGHISELVITNVTHCSTLSEHLP